MMILVELRDFLRENQRASLRAIALQFDLPPDAARGMLTRWIDKGRIRRLNRAPACRRQCEVCRPEEFELYQWVEDGQSIGSDNIRYPSDSTAQRLVEIKRI